MGDLKVKSLENLGNAYMLAVSQKLIPALSYTFFKIPTISSSASLGP
jgi:hypothetical protein